jgi:hypothetical protein
MENVVKKNKTFQESSTKSTKKKSFDVLVQNFVFFVLFVVKKFPVNE